MQKCNGNNIIEYIKYSDRIVRKLCREKGIYGDLKEQLLSEGIVGLARALKNYNIKKGASLQTYIYRNVKNEVNNYLREVVGKNPNGKKRAAFNTTHLEYLDDIDIFCNISNNIDKRIEHKDLIQKVFCKLSKNYVQIIILYDVEKFTFDEISQQLNYTRSKAQWLYHRAIFKFKTIYNELIKYAF